MSRRGGRRNRPRKGGGGGQQNRSDQSRHGRNRSRHDRGRDRHRDDRRFDQGRPPKPDPNEYVRKPGRIEARNGVLTITRDYWRMFPEPGEPLYIVIGDLDFEAEVRSYTEVDDRGRDREMRELDLEFMGGNIGLSKNRILKLVRREDEVHGYVYELTFIPIDNGEEEGEGE